MDKRATHIISKRLLYGNLHINSLIIFNFSLYTIPHFHFFNFSPEEVIFELSKWKKVLELNVNIKWNQYTAKCPLALYHHGNVHQVSHPIYIIVLGYFGFSASPAVLQIGVNGKFTALSLSQALDWLTAAMAIFTASMFCFDSLASFSLSFSARVPGCMGQSMQFTMTKEYTGVIPLFQWARKL